MKRFDRGGVRRAARAGFSMVEMAISITVLAVLSGALAQSVVSVKNLTVSSNMRSNLQVQGNQALLDVVEDLKQAGAVQLGGVEYPYVFEPGNAGADFAGHDHAPADSNGEAGDADFGFSREIVFVMFDWAPDPVTGEMKPTVDADAALVWDATEVSYRLVTGADGVNRLQRLEDAANPRLVAEHVERVVFDDAESSGFQIPLGSVRVRIWLRNRDGSGQVQRYFAEATVALTEQ